jgi:hypothetical protein
MTRRLLCGGSFGEAGALTEHPVAPGLASDQGNGVLIVELLVVAAALQVVVGWTAAAVVASRRGSASMDEIVVLVLAPLWGLGLIATGWSMWRHRHSVRLAGVSLGRHNAAAVSAARRVPARVRGWWTWVCEVFGAAASGSDGADPIVAQAGSAAEMSSQLMR